MNIFIDTSFDVRTDTPPGRDPDTYSATLRGCHHSLWSKGLPSGDTFNLTVTTPGVYLTHKSDRGDFRLSSDIMIPSYVETKKLAPLIKQVPPPIPDAFCDLAHTVGGFIIFPSNRVDKKMTINGARGCHSKIQDRFDLTLECIRRHYVGISSPLSETLERYSEFFKLFIDFRSYAEFFLLQDLISEDANEVRFHLPFDEFERPAFPLTVGEYVEYAGNAMNFIRARNKRISNAHDGIAIAAKLA